MLILAETGTKKTNNIHIFQSTQTFGLSLCGKPFGIQRPFDKYDKYKKYDSATEGVTEEFMRVHCANLQNAGIRICGNCVSTLYRDNR